LFFYQTFQGLGFGNSYPARESLVSDILTWDRKSLNLYLQCKQRINQISTLLYCQVYVAAIQHFILIYLVANIKLTFGHIFCFSVYLYKLKYAQKFQFTHEGSTLGQTKKLAIVDVLQRPNLIMTKYPKMSSLLSSSYL